MYKPKLPLLIRPKPHPVSLRLFQQCECSMNVRAHKFFWTQDRPIHMALRRKMNHCGRPALGKQAPYKVAIVDIAMHEAVLAVLAHRSKVRQVPGVREAV